MYRHPVVQALQAKRKPVNHCVLWQVVQALIYRQDLESHFADFSAQHAAHTRAQDHYKRTAAEVVGNPKKRPQKSFGMIMEKFAFEHLREILTHTSVISVPVDAFKLIPLSNCLGGSREVYDASAHGERLFTRVVDFALGKKQTLKLPGAASLSDPAYEDMGVTLHNPVTTSSPGEPVVSLTPHQLGFPTSSPVLILQEQGNFPIKHDEALLWASSCTLQYTMQGVGDDLSEPSNREITAQLLEAKAVEGGPNYASIAHTDPFLAQWRSLVQSGHVYELLTANNLEHRFQMMEQAIQNIKYGEVLQDPQPLFRNFDRGHIPLEDRTMYELVTSLHDKGFTWLPFQLQQQTVRL